MVPCNWIPSAECRDTGEQIQAVQREIRPVFIPAPDFRKWEILKHRCPQGDGSNLLISCLSTREGWERRKASRTKLKCREANRDVSSAPTREESVRQGRAFDQKCKEVNTAKGSRCGATDSPSSGVTLWTPVIYYSRLAKICQEIYLKIFPI